MGQTTAAALRALSVLSCLAACARTPVTPDKVPSPAPAVSQQREASPPPAPAQPPASEELTKISVFFDFDSYVLRPDAGPSLQRIAATAKQAGRAIRIEGHCDERGTPEYNLALGDGRARSAQQYLESLGVAKDKVSAVSFGSQRPKALGHDDAAWSQNRRSDVSVE
jgi:peptidoglycan-associated lipoprotein